MTSKKWVISFVLTVLAQLLSTTHAQNESFPYFAELDGNRVASLLDQRVYLSPTNGDSNTYFTLRIKQKGAQNKQIARVGLQWLRNIANLTSVNYRGAVVQIYTEFATNNPTITISDSLDYDIYKSNGGSLDYNEYLDQMVLGNQAGFFDSFGSSRFLRQVSAQVDKSGNYTSIELNFTIPELDPIGDSRLWYRWAFFDAADGVQPSDLRGRQEPYFYSTYASVADLFNTEEFLFLFYIILGLSTFWILGWPLVVIAAIWMQVSYIGQAFDAINYFNTWPGSSQYQDRLYLIIFTGWLEQFIALSILTTVSLVPLWSLPIDFLVVLYMYISYQYQGGTNDKRLYYKSMEEEIVLPEIIDHDAFFDIHFRGA